LLELLLADDEQIHGHDKPFHGPVEADRLLVAIGHDLLDYQQIVVAAIVSITAGAQTKKHDPLWLRCRHKPP
jgi:hypothetical protein